MSNHSTKSHFYLVFNDMVLEITKEKNNKEFLLTLLTDEKANSVVLTREHLKILNSGIDLLLQ